MKVRINPKKTFKTCDPGKCSFCQYIGDGCFLCEKYLEVVVDDWEPTDEFRMCARKAVKVNVRR